MSGTLGAVVPAGVTSGVLSTTGTVDALNSGVVVPLSASFCGVVTTTGVGRAGVLTSISVSFCGVVTTSGVGRAEVLISIVIGVEAGVLVSDSVTFLEGAVRVTAVGEVIGKVVIDVVVKLRVFVKTIVLGVWLTVTTMLVTGQLVVV